MHRDLKKLKMEVFYPYPPQRVWQVLTNRRALATWLMENDFEPRVGHKFRFQHSTLPGTGGSIDCEVIELDEPRRLSYTWQDKLMHQRLIVTWTLMPVDGGTRLQLEHKRLRQVVGLDELMHLSQPWQGQFMYDSKAVTQTLPPITRTAPLRQYLSVGMRCWITSFSIPFLTEDGTTGSMEGCHKVTFHSTPIKVY